MKREAYGVAAGLVLLALVLLLAGLERKAPAPPGEAAVPRPAEQSADLLLNWFPEMEHGGFYSAEVHGYYREEGIGLKILPGGPNTLVLPQIGARQVMFGIVNADELILAAAQGVPAVALMASLQTSPRCIMVHSASGVTRLDQLKDVTLAVDVSLPFYTVLKKQVPLQGVTTVPYSGNVAAFLLNKSYAQQAYVISEPFVARSQGGDPKCLMTSDLGFNPYASVLVTHRDVVAAHPDLVSRVVRASIRGWEQYLKSPEETHRKLRLVNPEMSLEALSYGAEAIRPLVKPEGFQGPVGAMTRERWDGTRQMMESAGLITADQARVDEIYSTRFIEAPVKL